MPERARARAARPGGRVELLEVLGPLDRHAGGAHATAERAAGLGGGRLGSGCRCRSRRRSCRLLRGRAARPRSRRRSGSSASSSRWVPRPTCVPSSSTRIWSASMMVETRWATMSTVASATTGAERGAQPGVGGQVERRERVVEEVDARACGPAARAMARRWRWPPETLVPPWAMRASSPPGIAATKSRAWAISSASHSSSSVASGLP